MFGLTTLGIIHTAISLVAVAAGAIALIRDKEITSHNRVGQVYIWTTVLTCLTGFGIFQHGGFGKPHMLGIITLVVLALCFVAGKYQIFGRASRYIETIGYSLTMFFHVIPAFTETSTRIPASSPLVASPDDPRLQAAIGAAFVLFLIGATLQVRRMHGQTPPLRPAL